MKAFETGLPAGARSALPPALLALGALLFLLAPPAARAQEEGKQQEEAAPVTINPAPEAGGWCRLKSDQVLLSGPGTNFKKVRRADAGLLLEIIGEKGEYYRVRVPDGFPCYIFHRYLEVDPRTFTGRVTGNNVNLRSIPAIEGDYPLFKVNEGDTLMVWERVGDWYKVTAPEAAYLYVRKDQVAPVTVDDAVREEIQALRARRRTQWEARLKELRAREEERRKREGVRSRLAELDAAVAAGFAGTGPEEVLQGYRELAESAPDEAVRRIARARAGEVEAVLARRKFEDELKRREENWRREREALLKRLEEAKRVKPAPATHTTAGRGRKVTVIGVLDTTGPEILLRGGKSLADVLYRVEAPDGRYVLADFNGKRIRILGRIADPPPAEDPALLVIERIEIL